MTREKLENFVPLGLLALVIVAGVVGVLTHTPPKKEVGFYGAEYDADFDVVGYFACFAKDPDSPSTKNFVLVRTPEIPQKSFIILEYKGSKPKLVRAGKPKDLSYFSAPEMYDVRETETRFLWRERLGNGKSYRGFSLNRSNGDLYVTSNIRGDAFTYDYKCDFGEQARNKVWLATEIEWERIRPKF